MVVEHNYDTDKEKLVGSWDGGVIGGTLEGQLRGSFSGSHPDMLFQGTGDGWYTSTGPDTFNITQNEDSSFALSGYLGAIDSLTCLELIDGLYYMTSECEDAAKAADPCVDPVEVTVEATSTCGQTASAVVDVDNPLSALSISGSAGNFESGDEYIASGGAAPYTFSASSNLPNYTTTSNSIVIGTVPSCYDSGWLNFYCCANNFDGSGLSTAGFLGMVATVGNGTFPVQATYSGLAVLTRTRPNTTVDTVANLTVVSGDWYKFVWVAPDGSHPYGRWALEDNTSYGCLGWVEVEDNCGQTARYTAYTIPT
jgi:hypothetical protein